ncbi:hypothetical protein ACFZCP_22145 [Streptomyces sp. NPDC007971]
MVWEKIRDRDPVAARTAMDDRTRTSQQQIIDALTASPSIAEADITLSR